MSPPTPLLRNCSPDTRQDTTADYEEGKRKRARMGVDICMSFHCKRGQKVTAPCPILFPQEQPGPGKRGQADRWLPTSVLCSRYRWGTSHCNLSLSVCLWDTPSLHPLSILLAQQKEWQTFRGNYLEISYNNHFVKSLNFPPFKPLIKKAMIMKWFQTPFSNNNGCPESSTPL